MKKWISRIFLLSALGIFLGAASFIKAQSCSNESECQNLIQQYTAKLQELGTQANTLSNQIAQFNVQIALTTAKIDQTQEQIKMLGGRIDQLETSLGSLTSAFSERAVETYKMSRSNEPAYLLLNAKNLNDVISSFHYLAKIQEADRNLMIRLQKAQNTYKGQKVEQEDLAAKLADQKALLNSQKIAKANLLAVTKNDEVKYQTLLSQARNALASLSGYAESVGISLIPHQELSDGWGKYLNQRDSLWGNVVMNNSYDCTDLKGNKVPCTIARVGCLITSYAMVVSHFGGSISPADVAVNPSSFYSTTAYFNNPGPSANGHSATRLDNPSLDQLRNALSSGGVVVAGLSMNGGPYPNHYSDHWVVLRSVDGDSFRINDPEYPGAMNVSLKDHYSGWTIIQANVYN